MARGGARPNAGRKTVGDEHRIAELARNALSKTF